GALRPRCRGPAHRCGLWGDVYTGQNRGYSSSLSRYAERAHRHACEAGVGWTNKESHMRQKKGTGLLMVWTDVPADKEADFNRWYNEEHLAERLSVPGFLSAARYEAVQGGPKHLAYYELESVAVLESEAYKRVKANPTEGTRRCSPTAIATTFIRNVYTLIHPTTVPLEVAQSDMAPALQIGRMDVPPEIEEEFNTWYNTIYVPNYEKVPGVIRGRRYRAVTGTPIYM